MDIEIDLPGSSAPGEPERGEIKSRLKSRLFHKRAETPASRPRIILLDEVRGLCVCLMVLYHLFYTAGEFFDFGTFSTLLRMCAPLEPVFAGLFIVICGISSRFSHSNLLRGLKLAGVAVLITVVTAGIMPRLGFDGTAIWFGILHMLSTCILLYALLAKPLGKVPAQIGILVCLVLYVFTRFIDEGIFGIPYVDAMNIHLPQELYDCGWLFPLGFHNGQFFSADYFPLLPWIFVFLAGTFAGGWLVQARLPDSVYRSHVRPLAFMGRHALIVYIVHQPIIFALCWPISLLIQ